MNEYVIANDSCEGDRRRLSAITPRNARERPRACAAGAKRRRKGCDSFSSSVCYSFFFFFFFFFFLLLVESLDGADTGTVTHQNRGFPPPPSGCAHQDRGSPPTHPSGWRDPCRMGMIPCVVRVTSLITTVPLQCAPNRRRAAFGKAS